MATGLTPTFLIPYPLDSDPVSLQGDLESLVYQVEGVMLLMARLSVDNVWTSINTFSGQVNLTSGSTKIGNTTLIQGGTVSITFPTTADTLVGLDTSDVLTNKSISGATNTITDIGNASLSNSAVTIGSTEISLGGTSLVLAGITTINLTTIPTDKTIVVTTDIGASVQGWDGDLSAIASIAGTLGILSKTAIDTWMLDTNTYLTTSSAAGTYLTIGDAGTTYLTISNASSTYLTIANASTTYLTLSAASSTYSLIAGSSSIVTLGTVTTGTWNASAMGVTYGGTAQTTYAAGDILYASAIDTLAKLAAGTNGHILTLSAGLPVWAVNPGLISPMTTLGDIIYGGASGAATRLAGNTTTTPFFLTSTGAASAATAPVWTTSTGTGSIVLSYSATLTGVPLAPTAAAATNTTQIATTEFVRAEIASLVAAAPSTLDTLNELALALGSDANFSTTVANSLALKAPLASPTLTGTPLSTTASVDTSTTQIATTAFVINQAYAKLAGPTFTGLVTMSGNLIDNINQTAKTAAYALVLSDANTTLQMNGAYAFTVPLNSTQAYPIGTKIHLIAHTTGVTVVFTGGITSYATPGLKLRAAGSVATLMKLATDTWALFGDLTA